MGPEIVKLSEIVGAASAFALIIWLVKRTFTHTIPRLADDFKAALDAQFQFFKEEMRLAREEYQSDLKRQRDDFRDELRSEREDYQKALTQLRDDFKSEIQYLGQRIDRLSDTIRQRGE